MKDTCETACKKFLGYGEFNSPSNIVRADPFYKKSIEAQYGKEEVSATLTRLWKEMTS